jgi:hypothetical protein
VNSERADWDEPSFDDDVLTSAQYQARILRELGYHTAAAHVDRFLDRHAPGEEEQPAA